MRRTTSVIVLLFAASIPPAYSQTFPSLPGLPRLDGINVFYRGGALTHSSALQSSSTSPCPRGSSSFSMCGWGVESFYQLNETKSSSHWRAELAIGYDFLNLHATLRRNKTYEILGSFQTLPSFTLYVSRELNKRTAVYSGLGTGLLWLKNVRAYDSSGRIYSIEGNTWSLTPSIGATYRLGPVPDAHAENDLGTAFFLEASYEVRDFASLAYTLPSDIKALPPDLPRRFFASGPVLNVGFEITLSHSKPDKS
jgi:hypothetical protein